MHAPTWTVCSKPRKYGDPMYSNPTSALAAGSVSATGAVAAGGADAFWAVLAGFALFAATTAVWRILPRKEE
jgi:hypothetical protein